LPKRLTHRDAGGVSDRDAAETGQRSRVLELLRRHGYNATSFQVLEGGFVYWFGVADACVAYVDTGGAWVAAGAPIAAEDVLGDVAQAFVRAAAQAGRSVCFFATERRFVELGAFAHLLIGEQPVWDPRHWEATLRASSSLREQLRRARAKGVSVERAPSEAFATPGAPLRLELERLIETWQLSKAMPPMEFLVRVAPFEFATERRLLVARQGERIVGLAAVVPVYARGGWFVEDLLRTPDAPNGTTELLVDAAMRDAAALGSGYLTLGLAPLAGDVPLLLGLARRYAAPLYDFRGLGAFKAKFRPSEWVPIYLSHPRAQSSWAALYHSLRAFSRRGLLRYGLETLLRGPDVVIRGLALLLVPWTLLLALLDGDRWFPAAWVQWSWVGFDLVLSLALLALGRRFRPWLSRAIVSLVTLDAVLTLAQALAFNVPRLQSSSEALGVAVAVAAPAVASRILANAHRRSVRVSVP
jgi:phosphatidylglycerol lysyltransferase